MSNGPLGKIDRRKFLGTAALSSAMAMVGLPVIGAGQIETKPRPSGTDATNQPFSTARLKHWRDRFHADLFDDFLPFCQRYVIDRERGGFMCETGPDGKNIDTDKATWFQARGAWVYSFLYNHFEKREEYLKIARDSLDILLNFKRPSMDKFLPKVFDQKGVARAPDSNDIFGDLFFAEGLQEYAKATGEDKWWQQAKELLFNCVRLYDQPDFVPEVTSAVYSKPGEAPANWAFNGRHVQPITGARYQGVWFTMLHTSSQMLEYKNDKDLVALADRCMEAVLEHHWNPRFNLTNEFINHDLSRPTNEYEGQVYLGHSIETQWMILYEALRRGDPKLFHRAAERFRRHVTVAKDNVYGGVFRNLANVDANEFSLDKAEWCQLETLNGSMLLLEHLGDPWAAETFGNFFDYIEDNFPLRRHGIDSPYWISVSDTRMVSYDPKGRMRVENYHHPRQLMLSLLALDRMIERGGKPSGLPLHPA
jgi:mannose/cellobiose epimerase-like protein (N-acyl-D-glucosamine 2-epimerase family)